MTPGALMYSDLHYCNETVQSSAQEIGSLEFWTNINPTHNHQGLLIVAYAIEFHTACVKFEEQSVSADLVPTCITNFQVENYTQNYKNIYECKIY